MAYLIGLVTRDEAKELERRGWELEEPPEALCTVPKDDRRCVMVWVDCSLFGVMDGPDWEKNEDDTGTEPDPNSGSQDEEDSEPECFQGTLESHTQCALCETEIGSGELCWACSQDNDPFAVDLEESGGWAVQESRGP